MSDKNRKNFGALHGEFSDYEKSQIVILPVPFERTSTWIRGCREGPRAVIEASENVELYDIETKTEVYKKGISTESEVIAKDSRGMIEKVSGRVRNLLRDKKFVVTLGGEHTVALGALKAHAEFFSEMTILHLDAHADMRDIYEGDKYSHACVMRRAKEMVNGIVSVGVRSMDSSELPGIDEDNIFFAEDIRNSKDWITRVIEKLSANTYVTIDLDVFDSGVMPSTGTPEPGGLNWYDVTCLLKNVFENRNVVGFDVVELCPSDNKAPDFLAAKLVYKLLSYGFSNEIR